MEILERLRTVGHVLAILALTTCGLILTVTGLPARGYAQMTSFDRTILEDATRPEERALDPHRKPLELFEWLGLRPGMAVADVFSGRGYNTHLLARALGDDGEVVSVHGFYGDPDFFGGQVYAGESLPTRVRDAGLDNVTIVRELADVPSASVDAAVIVRNYHDVEWFAEDWKRSTTVAEIFRIVKPGGVVGIVDVATPHPGWHSPTHRLNEQTVVDDFTAGGFRLEATSDPLANPDDDHSTTGFDAGRHLMDRYVLKFRKPMS